VHNEFASLFKDLLLSETDVSRLALLRRATLFTQRDKADAIYFLEDGLIKLTRTNAAGGRLILSLYGPNDLLGEESLSGGNSTYHAEAEVLCPSIVYKIPWAAIKRVIAAHPELSEAFLRHVLESKHSFARKVELLCLQDVETRILYYLDQLAKLVKPSDDQLGCALPITQLELADLVGATRETISTTLNHLERRGFVRLSRRLVTIFPRQSAAIAASAGHGC
jgi:CRP/FNR family cyclic AMP-dependent transcriptional regulator